MMKWKLFILCFLTYGFIIHLVQSKTISKKKNLYLGGFFAVDLTEQNWRGGGVIPSVQMAIEDINNRKDILRDYNLVLLWNDTKVRVVFAYVTIFITIPTKLQLLYLRSWIYFAVVSRCNTTHQSIL